MCIFAICRRQECLQGRAKIGKFRINRKYNDADLPSCQEIGVCCRPAAVLRKLVFVAALLLSMAVELSAQYDKDVFFYRGRLALSDGKYAQAIENFNVLARLDTADYWTFFFRGIAKYNLGDIRGAQQDFDSTIR